MVKMDEDTDWSYTALPTLSSKLPNILSNIEQLMASTSQQQSFHFMSAGVKIKSVYNQH